MKSKKLLQKMKLEMKVGMVSTKSLSLLLDIPERTLRTWTLLRTIPYHKVGSRLVRFDLKEIDNWIKFRSSSESARAITAYQ